MTRLTFFFYKIPLLLGVQQSKNRANDENILVLSIQTRDVMLHILQHYKKGGGEKLRQPKRMKLNYS